MIDHKHTVLCVDDEENILHSLKRLLRKEGYRILTASSGEEGLKLLAENEVNLIMSDQRMPHMSGTEFLSVVKERYPDTIRIVLTGYTEVDAITGAINEGHIYKFFLKPWNDQILKLEIKQALEQYDLIQTNRALHETILQQNEELKTINENLEALVKERTKDLNIQNHALELSRAVLEDLPLPIIGVSAEGMVVLINKQVETLQSGNKDIVIGRELADCFSTDLQKKIMAVLETNNPKTVKKYHFSDKAYNIDLTPLSGKFRSKGVVLALRQVGE